MPGFTIGVLLALFLGWPMWAQTKGRDRAFPVYLGDRFDYAAFTRFEAKQPPKKLIYQSNGFLALQEAGFARQRIIFPVSGPTSPTNTSFRVNALTVDSPVLIDTANRRFDLETSSADRSITYFADRTVYRASFVSGPEVLFTVYPVYGSSTAVFRITIIRAHGPLRTQVQTQAEDFGVATSSDPHRMAYGAPRWPYRCLVAAKPSAVRSGGGWEWTLRTGASAALTLAVGGDDRAAGKSLAQLLASRDLLDRATHRSWNQYLASVPLVAPAEPVPFTVGASGQQKTIAPKDLLRSELWSWRGALNTTCQASYLPACPMTVADWNIFMGMWSNDGTAEAIALAGTGRSDLARAALLNWFRYAVNAQGDGTCAWTIFPSGANTFEATGPERETQGVPVQASLVGEYVRLTGDTGVLDAHPGGVARDRTVWEALVAYERNLLKVRDINQDHLIDWMHTYETGWDDKDSPFVDCNGDPTSAINEQVDHLWSLQEMVYLSRFKKKDPNEWLLEMQAAKSAVRTRLWDAATERYWDLDLRTGKLWTRGENLDAYYLLYFEPDPSRITAMLRRLHDPAKFNGALLPTLAFDTPDWGGYWRGPAWPRIFSYLALALSRAGHELEGFDWLVRAINANLGPILPESVDPKIYPPHDHINGSVRMMGYDALDTLVLPDLAGMRSWAGQDLTLAANAQLGKVYIRGQRWLGERYDAIFAPGEPTRVWRQGRALPPMAADRGWRAVKVGRRVTFRPIESSEVDRQVAPSL